MQKINYSIVLMLIGINVFLSAAGQKAPNNLPEEIKDRYVFFQGGKIIIDKDTTGLEDFWLSKYTVTNQEYLEFLNDLRRQGRKDDLQKALPDTAQWKNLGISYKKYERYYLRHSAYGKYPVVNINHEAAEMYCEWLTESINKNTGNNMEYRFSLPQRSQWVYAAEDENISPYAWENRYLRDDEGDFKANFRYIPNRVIQSDSRTGEIKIADELEISDSLRRHGSATAAVNNYIPSTSGLYNMNGNVAELVREPGIAIGGSWNSTGYNIRNRSVMPAKKTSPLVGFRILLNVKE